MLINTARALQQSLLCTTYISWIESRICSYPITIYMSVQFWDEKNNALLVSVGAIGNVDNDFFRSRIRRFVLNASTAAQFPIDYTTGEVYADGVWNEVAMELSPKDNVL